MDDEKRLTDKQLAFVNEYVKDFCAAAAARRAGYSEATARQQGHRMLTNVYIAAEIATRVEAAMPPQEILQRLGQQAANIQMQFLEFNRRGKISINLKKMSEAGYGHLIKGFTYDGDGGIKKVEFYDAQKALELLGRNAGLFGEDKIAKSVDLSKLNNEQLERLAAGENILAVLATPNVNRDGENCDDEADDVEADDVEADAEAESKSGNNGDGVDESDSSNDSAPAS